MSILVVGSVAFDDITSPSGSVENILGGAATYFALAASYFTEVRVVAVVGEDFGPSRKRFSTSTASIPAALSAPRARPFAGVGRTPTTSTKPRPTFTDLNVFETFQPQIPKEYEDTDFLFLANIQPTLAGRRAAQDEWRAPDRLRHHELLDQGHAARSLPKL